MENNILDYEILTVKEVACYLRVSRVTVWRWCQSGLLPAHQLGRSWRIYREDLLQFLQKPENDLGQSLPAQDAAVGKREHQQ